MKGVADEVSLAGKLDTITVMELRRQPGEVLACVSLGKTFVVTKSGKPIAIISKPPGEQLTIEVDRKGRISYVK